MRIYTGPQKQSLRLMVYLKLTETNEFPVELSKKIVYRYCVPLASFVRIIAPGKFG